MNIIDQARRYLDKVPIAVSGQHGHDQTLRAACVLIQGFGLTIDQARPLMTEYSRNCQPAWSEKEIEHKLKSAENIREPKGKGYLINNKDRSISYRFEDRTSTSGSQSQSDSSSSITQPKEELPPKRYALGAEIKLPEPLLDGARELLTAAFQPGEGIRICIARTNEDGKEVPKDAGLTLTREEWMARLEKSDGDPNKFTSSPDRNGIFISINPLKIGGSRDSDVTAFRHCLLEFDEISHIEQWNLITASKIPVTAVISSGGRSLHAWVKIDAKDRAEYDERVKILYRHFAQYKPDEKNKNPSRFSRLPNCVRFENRQELLALKQGCESFLAWQIEQEVDNLGQEFKVKDLLGFDPAADENSVLGKRWLCRGGSCLFIGQSGIGKSSLAMQLAVLWGLGRPAFGIAPVKPLKSLFVQAENDLGDIAEMFQGVWEGMKLPGGDNPEFIRQVEKNLVIRKITTHTGPSFCDALRRLIDRYKPDLVWLDPALAYIGDDISKQSVCSAFFRNGLNPISEITGVIWMILHHTGKPPKDPKSKSSWNQSDFSYDGLGSSDLTNWSRAVMVLRERGENTYELKLPKRGKRANAKDHLGNPTCSVYLQHSSVGICWEQIPEPQEEEEEKPKKSRYKAAPKERKEEAKEEPKAPVESQGDLIPFDLDAFLHSIRGEHLKATNIATRLEALGVSHNRAWKELLPLVKEKMVYDPMFKTYSV